MPMSQNIAMGSYDDFGGAGGYGGELEEMLGYDSMVQRIGASHSSE
jgi:hypothetical protein